MPKPFSKLRHALEDADISRVDIAVKLGKSRSYVDERMRGERAFSIRDAYAIIDVLNAPVTELAAYFPRTDTPEA